MKKISKYHYSTITKEQSKDSGLAIILILLLVGIFFKNDFLFLVSTLVLIITMIYPLFFRYFAYFWYSISEVLGSIVSKIILTLIFIFIVSPVGLIRRLIGKDSLNLKKYKKGSESVMKIRNILFKKTDLEKPY
tara:strand:+ start:101 stop:502 length:402 start_codon:yes stop_codon:yes gene_type:complete